MCALTVAPLYCLVAVKCGKGAATDPELANWAEVRPLGPEGKVGCKVNPETREASTSKEEEEEVDMLVVVRPGGGEVGNCFQQGSRGAGATLSLSSRPLTRLSLFYFYRLQFSKVVTIRIVLSFSCHPISPSHTVSLSFYPFSSPSLI